MRKIIIMAALILATLGLTIDCSEEEETTTSDESTALIWDQGNWNEANWQ